MKYIRTKDGIYEVVDTYEVSYVIGYTEDGFEKKVYKEDVIKQADTIEELCDLFCLDRGADLDINDFYNTYEFDVAKKYYLEERRQFIPIQLRAYISTSKGLIYVAKMNEDGVLCLI